MAQQINARLYARAYGAPSARGTTPSAYGNPTTAPNCAPACADCGLLECLCRPRFFAGQLLTEQDLNRLDAYIRGKNRLHTLQLHGYGVVNGLFVRCDPCGKGVVVGTGYAISPCGDDIVVCSDTSVDVCALVKRCQPPDLTCQPYQSGGQQGCQDVIEDWVLAIRQVETPARGVAALRMGPSCSCSATPTTGGCGCAGKTSASGCGCGCGGKGKTTATATNGASGAASSCGCGGAPATKPRNASAECEPTVICEGYGFDVFPAPKPKEKTTGLGGALWDQFMCCLQPLVDSIPEAPGDFDEQSYDANPQGWNLWCCRMKQALLAFLGSGPEFDCTLATTVSQLACPDPASQTFSSDMDLAVQQLTAILIQILLACLCHALLPPAPCGTTDDRIPLAVVSVRKSDCAVVSVCNFTPLRRTVLTFPNLEYWLSWIPLWDSLAELLGALCCGNVFQRRLVGVHEAAAKPKAKTKAAEKSAGHAARERATMAMNPELSSQAATNNKTFAALALSAIGKTDAPVDPLAFVSAVFGLNLGKDHSLPGVESQNAPQFLLFNQVLRPISASVLGSKVSLGERLQAMAGAAAETSALKARVDALEATIKKMQSKR